MQSILANSFISFGDPSRRNIRELDIQRALLFIIKVMKGFWDSDARLLRAILADDTAAWQKFILKYSNFIYGAVIKYTDDYDEKMAVYLHILEKLHENRFERLRRFAFKAKLSTWLTVVSRRLALDFLRGRYGRDFSLKKIRVVSIDGELDYLRILADPTTPEKELANSERQTRRRQLEADMRTAMDNLGDQERLAVQMVYFQGMRIKEVGRLLCLPAAYKFIARSIKKIRAELEISSRLTRAEIEDVLEGEAHE